MTPFDEGKLLRREVVKLRPDKRRRYPAELRQRILSWVDRVTDAGGTECECAKILGVKTWRFTAWRRWDAREAQDAQRASEAPRAAASPEPLALVPVEVPAFSMMPNPAIVTPAGYRIEGLSLEQMVAVLRELA